MKISEAITDLQKELDKHGDIDIMDLAGFKKCKYQGTDTDSQWVDRLNLVFKNYTQEHADSFS